MQEKVRKLRQQSLEAVPAISGERARLITDFYKNQTGTLSAPMLRAQSFAYILENKEICINEGELIVGESGPGPGGHAHLSRDLLPQFAGPRNSQLAPQNCLQGGCCGAGNLYE